MRLQDLQFLLNELPDSMSKKDASHAIAILDKISKIEELTNEVSSLFRFFDELSYCYSKGDMRDFMDELETLRDINRKFDSLLDSLEKITREKIRNS